MNCRCFFCGRTLKTRSDEVGIGFYFGFGQRFDGEQSQGWIGVAQPLGDIVQLLRRFGETHCDSNNLRIGVFQSHRDSIAVTELPERKNRFATNPRVGIGQE